MTELYCHHYITDGAFDWSSNKKETQCALFVKGLEGLEEPTITVSEIWPLGECPVERDMLPSEVLNHISERVESYLISTGRDKERIKINTLREHIKAIDASWLRARIAAKERELHDLRYQLQDIEEAA